MRKKILIAVDQSLHARNAMKYAAQIAESLKEVDFALFHIQPMISQYLIEEVMKRSKSKAELENVYARNRDASLKLLEDCKAHLVSKGVDVKCIEIKTQARNHGIAEDILTAAEAGSYDAIIVGRRGIGGIQELFMGSVTSNLLASSRVIPVWVVDGIVTSGKVMIAVDGSSQSLRVVDHVAFIFSKNPEVQLQFVNIEPRIGDFCEIDTDPKQTAELSEAILNANERCIADFSQKAMGILKNAGIEKNRISFKTLKKIVITGSGIIETAAKEGFGTIVIGKTGADNSRNVGKVASHVLQKMSDRAVWVVP